MKFTIQVAAEDCTGCGICVDVCPAKNKSELRRKAINMEPQLPLREQERENWDFFLNIPNPDRQDLKLTHINQQQMQEPLFEFSGACAGCGETPYIKLATQLFGDRMIVANATGCSSIYGGNLPTTPWSQNQEGRVQLGLIHCLKIMLSLVLVSVYLLTKKRKLLLNYYKK